MRLTAAVDATARAGHDFHEVIVLLARAYGLDHLARAGETGRHGDLDGDTGDLVGGFFDGLSAAHFLEVDGLELAVHHVRSGTERRFHDAARRTEYRAAARRHVERIVVILVGQVAELDARRLDHLGELARRYGDVHVVVEFLTGDLELLCRAGYYAHHEQVFGIDAVLLAVIRFEHAAEHLLRGFAGGEIIQHVGIIVLHELYPAGAAGREHGQRLFAHDTLHQLGRLLHDGEVGGNVHVEDLNVAQATDGRDHLTVHVGAYGIIELLAQLSAYGRSGKEHDFLVGIGHGVPDLIGVRLFGERAHGASHYALAAAHAGRIHERHVERAADVNGVSPAYGAYRLHALEHLAGGHATTAVDALVVVADEERRRRVERHDLVVEGISVFIRFVFLAQTLQFAGAAAVAGQAFSVMGGEQQFQRELAGTAALGRVGLDLHALADRIHAGRYESARARGFHNAHTAGTHAVDVLEVAQRGYLHARGLGGLKYGAPFGDGYAYTVDFQVDHCYSLLTSSRSRRNGSWRCTRRT